ncbi:GTP-binding protein HflX [Mycobacterium ulcerans str. Harvey]|uniref:GTP-binding protein HflX n=1 Tax=Mycobacterium ulcerans str. Harvey TaxID=1299332 RepID=A0ABP3AF12_MYCUL|nr:GTP-binding protein HflX [Mycobacterium ulcerans str. Harvey]
MTYSEFPDSVRRASEPAAEPSIGELALEDRSALRRVAGLSTELADVSEVEYRQLRLERVVLVGVWTEGTAADNQASLAELAALAETTGSQVLEGLIQRRDRPDPSTYIGSGKAAELREVVVATGADTVICDGELSPAQLTALEKAVKVKVIDRTALILDIFAQHATSREGKAQVALAQMEYMLPRLRGWGESMSRQAGGRAGGSGGGVGLRGPGETKIETDRRRIRERMAKLRREIKAMKQARDTQRSRRLHSDVPSIAIVGYTNAGKSSLLNALTGAGSWCRTRCSRHSIQPPGARSSTPIPMVRGPFCSPTPSVSCAICPPAGRGVSVHAGGGHRRGSAVTRRRRLRPEPVGPDQRGAPGDLRGHRRRGHRRR